MQTKIVPVLETEVVTQSQVDNKWIGTSIIAPDGEVFPASYYHHEDTCISICEQQEIDWRANCYAASDKLAKMGYIKITSDGRIYKADYGLITKLKQAQFDAIWDMVVSLNAGNTPHDGTMTGDLLNEQLQGMEV